MGMMLMALMMLMMMVLETLYLGSAWSFLGPRLDGQLVHCGPLVKKLYSPHRPPRCQVTSV